ncbi:MAG TPA: hypothetical protein VF559_12570 [Caulobacteraceae bacterium]|jgi:hypothetical protein
MTYDLEPHTQARPYRQADEAVWEAARADYEAGCSAPVVAERHGLGERTVRRRASAEGWRRPARNAAEAGAMAAIFARVGAGLAKPDASATQQCDADPHLEEMVQDHTFEIGRLLFEPTPERLSRFAFRRAAECAARGAAAETTAWLRVCNAIDRSEQSLRRAALPLNIGDYARAALARELEHASDTRFGPDEAEEDEAEGEGRTQGVPRPEGAPGAAECPNGRMAGA